MNKLEHEMVEVLKRLKGDYGVFEIKAEFEAEGSRMEEMMRLKDVTTTVGLPIILKIGGVEAVTDIYNALSIGVKGIVAPMVETSFALSKYINMIKKMIADDNADDLEFWFNVETGTAISNLDDMLGEQEISIVDGITVGRVDLAGSYGVDKSMINSFSFIETRCIDALSIAKKHNLKTGVGGGISKESLPSINRFVDLDLLDKFETRKVVFPATAYKYGDAAILEAVLFELLWLKSKRRYYSRIKDEDEKRIAMLEVRLK